MDVEETLGALTNLAHQGKIRYIGSSSYAGRQIVEAQVAVPVPVSAARPSARFDMNLVANQQKLELVDALTHVAEDAGLTMNPADDSYGAAELTAAARRR
jgi:aryl-alcohol dehydrogenase-like predicted oxidoreductase